ncbi:putative extracellular cellulase CelA/allergen Asp F7-like [Aspergillus puulaauensis]|uniref:Expansin-like EG45 domain-containing protein n=1 Tax=Aspergillus puulaauensis TaxID=1220207 RepID=A0A7R7XYI7_9EURO|nr:uncharacterized protein APUU_80140S [Aspergillus puulaauensis]BCS29837.1 hypothetical protein APUU_80140S [Aspergillus puulaauensis]
MRYQNLASIALAALSASTSVSAVPLKPEENGHCPAGYSPSVYYITVTAEPTQVVEPTPSVSSVYSESSESSSTVSTASTTSSTATSSTTEEAIPTIGAIETIPAAFFQESSSTESTESPSSTLSIVESAPTQVAVAQPTTTTTTTEPQSTSTTTAATANKETTTSDASSSTKSAAATTSGKATFYGGNLSGGACSFSDYTIPSHLFGTAFSGKAWDNAAECGACVSVTGPSGNSIKAMIVDECPECASSDLDLFESAFTELGSASTGILPVSWTFTPCSITSPLILKNKEGTSAYWFSMQVVNANEAVASLEVSTDNGSTWQKTTRSEYNFFENDSGFGSESVDVRVTGASGSSVVVKNVGVSSGKSVTAVENL